MKNTMPENGDNTPLHLYMVSVSKQPMLSREDEQEVARRFIATQDPKLAQKLVRANLRFVIKIAQEHDVFNVQILDLIQEGNMGLAHAVKKFNPERGYRLISYAVWWIRAYMQNYIKRNFRIVRPVTTRAQRRTFDKLMMPEVTAALEMIDNGTEVDTSGLISDADAEYGISMQALKDAKREMLLTDVSIDQHDVNGDGSESRALDETLTDGVDCEARYISKLDRGVIREAIDGFRRTLDERELFIFENRLEKPDDPMHLEAIGGVFQISKERVRQLESRVKEKARTALEAAGCGDYL
ncbi:TPA: hypothetical protein DCZ16_05880 [Candidatus Peregrinibacteria bacterium]|nr:hypothetical protein [Candidatus Peregrinibacteria bacterium]